MLMLDQLGILSLGFYAREWWTWWPVLLIASGLASLVAPDGAKEAFKGLSLTLLGLWALACSQHWYGFSWGRSWPLVLVVVGLESILLAAFDRRSRAQAEKEAHDVGAA
ncbi:MAG: hypothetical protein HY076_02800 [Candidatus Eisenbacteria bacterium]|uniref:LiaF transmembrane domain-containing protein n=1 Tax=Eiseniibacteriota bacterium TaxID=2212470 RepID=A0A9D6QIC5_UNCEI|nr:hypothetical protein [Candidatus Eisenbacteria bacterium]